MEGESVEKRVPTSGHGYSIGVREDHGETAAED